MVDTLREFPILGHMPTRPVHRGVTGRRALLAGFAFASAAGALGLRPRWAAAEPPPEITTLRIAHSPAICFAPQYVAEDLLRAEGFTSVQYVPAATGWASLSAREADISAADIPSVVHQVDQRRPLVILAGLHVGCYELFGTARIRRITDLKGKSIGIPGLHSGRHLMLSTMLAHVGLDPRRDVGWVTQPAAESIPLLADEKIDAYMGFPPEPQELRTKRIGHVVVSTRSTGRGLVTTGASSARIPSSWGVTPSPPSERPARS